MSTKATLFSSVCLTIAWFCFSSYIFAPKRRQDYEEMDHILSEHLQEENKAGEYSFWLGFMLDTELLKTKTRSVSFTNEKFRTENSKLPEDQIFSTDKDLWAKGQPSPDEGSTVSSANLDCFQFEQTI